MKKKKWQKLAKTDQNRKIDIRPKLDCDGLKDHKVTKMDLKRLNQTESDLMESNQTKNIYISYFVS